jgi:hypothetical protein
MGDAGDDHDDDDPEQERGGGAHGRPVANRPHCRAGRGNKLGVIAGLDPAIHRLAKGMDARVKPGHDASR